MVAASEARGSSVTGADAAARDAGDEAFDSFAARERSVLVAFAWSLTGSFAEAEELAQDALTAAWRTWDRVGGYDEPRAWARRVIVNRAATRRRSAAREGAAMGRLNGRRDRDRIELPDVDQALWQAVRELPERQAQVVALHYVDDRSVAEVAEILDCSEGTVKTHLHRARLALARILVPSSEEDGR